MTLNFKQFFFVSSLAGLLIAIGGRSAQAESLQAAPQPDQAAAAAQTNTAATNAETVSPLAPAETSATLLQTEPQTDSPIGQAIQTEQPADATVAQAIDPGRTTRSGSSYIGVGGNIGFGGDTGLGTGNFAIISKVGLTPNLSLRPSALVGDGATFLLPATVDFPIAVSTDVDGERIGAAPYIGGGIAISTGDDSTVQPLATVGVDVPITDQFTANASANVSFPDDVEVGVILGIGYNFR